MHIMSFVLWLCWIICEYEFLARLRIKSWIWYAYDLWEA